MPSALILTRVQCGARKVCVESEDKSEISFRPSVAGRDGTLPDCWTERSRARKGKKYRVTYCAHTSPLPLLPSGPGGVGGIVSRRARH